VWVLGYVQLTAQLLPASTRLYDQLQQMDFRRADSLGEVLAIHPVADLNRVAKTIAADTTLGEVGTCRAAFSWVAHYIEYPSLKASSRTLFTAAGVLQGRKGHPQGVALLLHDLLKTLGYTVRVETGMLKYQTQTAKAATEAPPHTWVWVSLFNGFQVCLDPFLAAGERTFKGKFVRYYQPAWFAPHPSVLVYTHRPQKNEISYTGFAGYLTDEEFWEGPRIYAYPGWYLFSPLPPRNLKPGRQVLFDLEVPYVQSVRLVRAGVPAPLVFFKTGNRFKITYIPERKDGLVQLVFETAPAIYQIIAEWQVR
jgi:hypothetical protein